MLESVLECVRVRESVSVLESVRDVLECVRVRERVSVRECE